MTPSSSNSWLIVNGEGKSFPFKEIFESGASSSSSKRDFIHSKAVKNGLRACENPSSVSRKATGKVDPQFGTTSTKYFSSTSNSNDDEQRVETHLEEQMDIMVIEHNNMINNFQLTCSKNKTLLEIGKDTLNKEANLHTNNASTSLVQVIGEQNLEEGELDQGDLLEACAVNNCEVSQTISQQLISKIGCDNQVNNSKENCDEEGDFHPMLTKKNKKN
ncbi:hypothetical protein MA16_Dca011870 [Dendrobium catenatum]|uniref:Uncharacterized protein n=1 Tax=Dendrobium catenatum TaxID=906689 RepID=A0A2I0WEC3_9ASPA|nr:hypothetical protein MA16_Dca011870 [Dendrobium catenatum]